MNKQSTKPKIKKRQAEILTLLYRFRYLNRVQIQSLLNHKNHSLVIQWLKELTECKYIKCNYDKKFISKPSVYYLAPLGRKYLKENPDINPELLSRVWREKNYTDEFKEHCFFLADVYLSLRKTLTESTIHYYAKTDLYGMEGLIKPAPDAYFAIEERDGTIKRYFLELFDNISPRVLRTRINQYFKYFESDEWQDNTDKPFPEIIVICPNRRIKTHLNYYIQSKLDDDDLNFYLSDKETVKRLGLRKEALQKVMTET